MGPYWQITQIGTIILGIQIFYSLAWYLTGVLPHTHIYTPFHYKVLQVKHLYFRMLLQ